VTLTCIGSMRRVVPKCVSVAYNNTMRLNCLFLTGALCLLTSASWAQTPIYTNPKAAVEARVNDLFGRLTQPEKLALLTLNDFGDGLNTAPIPRLGIPAVHTADGPNAVRYGQAQATVFPMGVVMASTWNPALVEQASAALGQEAAALHKQVLYGPDLNIHRSPQGGRNFESFSEDPFLTAKMGVAYVTGIQSEGVAACLKHYVCNDQETNRGSVNVLVDSRTLHEIYLPPFEAAVKESHAWSAMDAMNRVNGSWVAANSHLLADTLKTQFGFDGVVVSDWGAIHDTVETVKAGTDLEMPNPAFFSPAALTAALQNGQITQAMIDDKARRVLRLIIRTRLLDGGQITDAARVNSILHQKLARKVAQEGIILLKNAGNLLPLDQTKIRSIAVIGPNAAVNELGGRASADVTPFYSVSVLDSIKARAAGRIAVSYTLGTALTDQNLDPIPSSALTPPDAGPGEHGLRAEYFANQTLTAPPAVTRLDAQVSFNWDQASPDGAIPHEHFSSRWTGFLTPPVTGHYIFGLNSDDGSRLFLDGKLVIDYWSDHSNDITQTTGIDLQAGHAYKLLLEQYQGGGGAGMTLGWTLPPGPELPFRDAVAAARQSDIAIVVVGLGKKLEGEGLDPSDLRLPGKQDELIQAVAAVNKRTIVVMVNGTPLLMDKWLAKVPGVMEAWYAGDEAGNAVTDILFGDVNPSGHLTDTLAFRREDYSDFASAPGPGDILNYSEGIYVGYRHFDKAKITPLFPFGYGLSYTTFAYSKLSVPKSVKRGQTTTVRLTVQNTGKVAGADVVQVYVRDLAPRIDRPVQELKGFQKVMLQPGQKSVVTITLDERAFSYYDAAAKRWAANPGMYEIEAGASSRDIRLQSVLRLE